MKRAYHVALKQAERFFYQHAGYSRGPEETAEQGRKRGARILARAERKAVNGGFSFRWSIDPDVTSADWITWHAARIGALAGLSARA